jgi:hypothetical protein
VIIFCSKLYKIASLLLTTAQWSNNTTVGIVFYSGARFYKTGLVIPEWISTVIEFGEKPVHYIGNSTLH